MRLLRRTSDDDFSLTEFHSNVPAYAILSHRWESEEVRFQDVMGGTAKTRKGFRKLELCANQAARDNIEYLWIDTCCIDDSNTAEVTDAIGKLSSWYEKAHVCYVFHGDVAVNSLEGWAIPPWFTSTWILQELPLPDRIIYSQPNWRRLVHTSPLSRKASDLTENPIEPLARTQRHLTEQLWTYGLRERERRAALQEITYPKDLAYLHFGPLTLCFLMFHGEVQQRTLQRLKHLKQVMSSGLLSYDNSRIKRQTRPTDEVMFERHHRLYRNTRLRFLQDESDSSDTEDNLSEIIGFGGYPQLTPVQKYWYRPGADYNKGFIHLFPDTPSTSVDLFLVFGLDEVSSEPDSVVVFDDTLRSVSSSSRKRIRSFGYLELEWWLLLIEPESRQIEYRKAWVHQIDFPKNYVSKMETDTFSSENNAQAAKLAREKHNLFRDTSRICESAQKMILQFFPELRFNKEPTIHGLCSVHATDWNKVAHHVALADKSTVLGFDFGKKTIIVLPEVEFSSMRLSQNPMLVSHNLDGLIHSTPDWTRLIDISSIAGPDVDYRIEEIIEDKITREDTCIEAMEQGKSMAYASELENNGSIPGNPELDLKETHVSGDQESQLNERSHQQPIDDRESTSSVYTVNQGRLSILFDRISEILGPRIPPGYERVRWQCSCGTHMWGDFPGSPRSALEKLKLELGGMMQCPVHQHPSLSTPSVISDARPTADSSCFVASHTGSIGNTRLEQGESSSYEHWRMPMAASHHVVNMADSSPRYFEVCVNIPGHAVRHYEIDFRDIHTDRELFEQIWERYISSRGGGLRSFFLQPKDIHFVKFSVNRRVDYGTGIHEKPDVFPPKAELDGKRYHYEVVDTEKVIMPPRTFLHYLERAKEGLQDAHNDATWIKYLPKKLNESMLAAAQLTSIGNHPGYMACPDLAFGWGVHIINGPNHKAIAWLVAVGVSVSFIVSVMVVGIAKTQEQGFGVGSFLLAIVVSIVSALHFTFQD